MLDEDLDSPNTFLHPLLSHSTPESLASTVRPFHWLSGVDPLPQPRYHLQACLATWKSCSFCRQHAEYISPGICSYMKSFSSVSLRCSFIGCWTRPTVIPTSIPTINPTTIPTAILTVNPLHSSGYDTCALSITSIYLHQNGEYSSKQAR